MSDDEMDRQCVETFREGDQEAFKKALRDYHQLHVDQIYRMLFRRFRYQFLAWELQTMVTEGIWKAAFEIRRGKYQRQPRLSSLPWTKVVVMNHALDMLSRKQEFEPIATETVSDRSSDLDVRIDALAATERLMVQLAKALDNLPSQQRKAIELAIIEGKPLDQVASELKVQESGAGSYVTRGLQAIRQQLRTAGISLDFASDREANDVIKDCVRRLAQPAEGDENRDNEVDDDCGNEEGAQSERKPRSN